MTSNCSSVMVQQTLVREPHTNRHPTTRSICLMLAHAACLGLKGPIARARLLDDHFCRQSIAHTSTGLPALDVRLL